MYSQSTGEDNTDHLSKDFRKYKADNAEYTFFPWLIFSAAMQCLKYWMYFIDIYCLHTYCAYANVFSPCTFPSPAYSSTFLPLYQL